MTFKVLVTGSRNLVSYLPVYAALDSLYERHGGQLIVIHGDARGADRFADTWAVFRDGVSVVRMPADWSNDGLMAGPNRNGRMLELGPDLVLAFYQKGEKNRGTANMVSQALAAKVPVAECHLDKDGFVV